jgi:hypothetical protein
MIGDSVRVLSESQPFERLVPYVLRADLTQEGGDLADARFAVSSPWSISSAPGFETISLQISAMSNDICFQQDDQRSAVCLLNILSCHDMYRT